MTVSTTGTVTQTLAALYSAIDLSKVTPRACLYLGDRSSYSYFNVLQLVFVGTDGHLIFSAVGGGTPHVSNRVVSLDSNTKTLQDKDTTNGNYASRDSQPASSYFGATITLYY